MQPTDAYDAERWPGIEDYDRGQLKFSRLKWEAIRHHLPESLKGRRVLDVGCWSGYTSLAFALDGADVTGFDVVGPRLDTAREQAERFGVEVDFEQRNLFRVGEWMDKPYDIVWSAGIVHNMMQPRRAVFCMAHASSGWLVIECRTDDVPWGQLRVVESHEGDYHTQTAHIPSPRWMEAVLCAAGFEIKARGIRYTGDRSWFVARRRAEIIGDESTDFDALPDGTIAVVPISHPVVAAVEATADGADMYGASGAPSWLTDDIVRRFDPAQFVPAIYNHQTGRIGDGERRIRAARRLGLYRVKVMRYLGDLSPSIYPGCSSEGGV